MASPNSEDPKRQLNRLIDGIETDLMMASDSLALTAVDVSGIAWAISALKKADPSKIPELVEKLNDQLDELKDIISIISLIIKEKPIIEELIEKTSRNGPSH